MSDALRKVQAGQKLVIPAAAYNAFIDAAVDYRRRTARIGQKAEPSQRQAGIVLVRNDSGGDLNRLAVLGIDAPVFTPTDSLETFANGIALVGVTPTAAHAGNFAVLVEPIQTGQLGRTCCRGTPPAATLRPSGR